MAQPINQTQNRDGKWVPSIPLPFYGLRKRCGDCGEYYFTMAGYQGHYALVHILKLGSTRKERKSGG